MYNLHSETKFSFALDHDEPPNLCVYQLTVPYHRDRAIVIRHVVDIFQCNNCICARRFTEEYREDLILLAITFVAGWYTYPPFNEEGRISDVESLKALAL